MEYINYIFYMKVSATDEDMGLDANVANFVNEISHWYYARWLLYKNDIFVEKLPKIVHEGENVFKVSYYGLKQNLGDAVTNSRILADPDDYGDYSIILNGDFYLIHGYPINQYTNQAQ